MFTRNYFHPKELWEFHDRSTTGSLLPGLHYAIVRQNRKIACNWIPVYFSDGKFLKLQILNHRLDEKYARSRLDWQRRARRS
jgi:hypothetical protein